MRSVKVVLAVIAASLLGLTACSSKKPPILMNVRSETDGPDEFSILPAKPLEMPEDLAALPPPTPGGANRTDQHPEQDAIVALGGTPNTTGKIPSGDSTLIAYSSRNGVDPAIRQTLAAEDYEFRREHNGRVLERLAGNNVYFKAYSDFALDQYLELLRWRKAGVRTPAAPPPESDDVDSIN